MAIKLPSYLHRSRSGILHFRIAIPPDLRHHFGTKEIYRSLQTASVREAAADAQALSITLRRVFTEFRQQPMSDTENPSESPLIDQAKLAELLRSTKQKLKLHDRIEQLEDEVIESHRQRLRDNAQHARELDLVMSAMSAASVSSEPAAPASKKKSILVSDAIEEFKRAKLASKKWLAKTEEENMAIYSMLIRIIGDKPIAEIEDDDAVMYLETLQKLPPNINKIPIYIGKTTSEIIAMSPEPMGVRTINKNIERISSLFKWALNKPKYGVTHNPFSGASLDESGTRDRQPFTTAELIALFSSPEFISRRLLNAYAYWLPLMGLYTGARLGELCQLYCSDFVEIGGVPCIDITDEEEGQKLKNRNAKRLVPIHDRLIELGLLRYVANLRQQGVDRLFSELSSGRDGFSGTASKWFGRYKQRCGIHEKHTKVFHSFRHTFISILLNDEVPEFSVAPIVGHEGKLITSKIYWNVKDPIKRKPTIEKFQLPNEVWRLIPKFEDVIIVKGEGRSQRGGI
jgi:integrase